MPSTLRVRDSEKKNLLTVNMDLYHFEASRPRTSTIDMGCTQLQYPPSAKALVEDLNKAAYALIPYQLKVSAWGDYTYGSCKQTYLGKTHGQGSRRL